MGNNITAKGNDSVAIGANETVAGSRAIALGYKARADATNAVSIGTYSAAGTNSVGIGYSADATQDKTVAIGNSAYAGVESVQIGSSEVTAQSNHRGAFRRGTTLIGTEAVSQGLYSTVTGNHSQLYVNQNNTVGGIFGLGKFTAQGAFTNLYGAYNTVGNNTSSKDFNSVAVTVVGSANEVQESNGAFVAGYGNNVTNSYKGDINVSLMTDASSSSIAKILNDPKTELGQIGVIGAGNKLDTANNTLVMGMRNAVTVANKSSVAGFNQTANAINYTSISGADSTVKNTNYVYTAGVKNTINNADNVIALGNNMVVGSSTTAAKNSILLGNNIAFASKDNMANAVSIGDYSRANTGAVAVGVTAQALGVDSIAIGRDAIATGSLATGASSRAGNGGASYGDGAVATYLNGATTAGTVASAAFGQNAQADVSAALALGTNALVTQTNSVALGADSIANTAATPVAGFAGATPVGVISVGSVGKERQIQNVAAGQINNLSTDAVNGSQLYAVWQAANAVSNATSIHYVSINDNGTQGGNYANDGATGINAVAIGVDAQANGNGSVALGYGAGKDSTNPGGASIYIGQSAGSNSDGSGNLHLGALSGLNAQGNTNSYIGIQSGKNSIGEQNTFHGQFSGAESNGYENNFVGQSSGALSIGNRNNYIGTGTGLMAQGSYNAAIGASAGLDSRGNSNSQYGTGAAAAAQGDNNVAMGTSAGSAYVTSIDASGNTVWTDRLGNAVNPLNLATTSAASNTVSVGNWSWASVDEAVAVGNSAMAKNIAATALGSHAIAEGGQATAVGAAAAANGMLSSAFGSEANAYGNVSLAAGFKSEAADESVAVGVGSKAVGVASVAVGIASEASAERSMALGAGSISSEINSVALGTESITTAATSVAGFAGAAPVGVVSVGSAGKERQIQNVAAGQINDQSTDAINGSQLYATNVVVTNLGNVLNQHSNTLSQHSNTLAQHTTTINQNSTDITELQKGWTLASNNGTTSEQITAGETVNFNPGKNIAITQAGNAISIATTPNVVFDQVTVGGVVINKTTGINAGNTVISNVAAGSALTDAVNVSQLNKAMANTGGTWDLAVNNDPARSIGKGSVIKFEDGKNIAITQTGNAISIATTPNVAFDQVTVGGVVINKTTGINAGGLKITNVNDGVLDSTSKDAVNGSQLHATNTIVTNLGNVLNQHSNTLVQHANTLAQHTTTINQNSTDITELQKGWTLASNNGAQTEQITAGETVNFNPGKNIAITQAGNAISIATTPNVAFDQVTVGGVVINKTTGINAGNTVISNVAAGSKGTDAVNVSQLDAVKNIAGAGWNIQTNGDKATQVKPSDTVDIGTAIGENNIKVTRTGNVIDFELNKNLDLGSTGSVKMGDLTLNNSGLSIVNGPSITANGIDAGSKTIGNVAPGSKGTDAVNMNQLEAVKTTAGKGWMLQSDGDKATQVQPGDVVDIGVANGEKNITVSRNGNTVDFALNKNLDLGATGSVAIGGVLMNDKGFSINNGPSMTADGINAGNKAISNVATATALTDAVNLSQLNQAIAGAKYAGLKVENGSDTILANESLNIVGKDGTTVTYDKNSNTYTVSSKQGGGTGTGSMNDWNVTGKDGSGGSVNVPITDGKNVAFAAGSKNVIVTPSQTADGAQVQVDIAKDLELSSVTTKNANGNSTVLNGDGVIAKNANGSSTVVNGNGVTIKGKDGKNGASITQAGIDAGNQTLKNVADGQNDTDAVNVRQLNQMGSTINHLGNRITEVEDNANAGTAAAMAMANLPQPANAGEGGMSLGLGTYQGESGYAVGYSAVSESGNWIFKASATGNSQGKIGAGAGVFFKMH